MALARPRPAGWTLSLEPVGPVATLLARLREAACGGPVALGVDFPIGLPRAFAMRHAGRDADFPSFLRAIAARPGFFDVAETLAEAGPARPFYPRRGTRGVTRLSHAQALGFDTAADLSRACDRATPERPAGAPLFWTLGANQTGKAAIAAWRDLLLPALASAWPPALWPFDGPFRSVLGRSLVRPDQGPGPIAIAETYPADGLRQIGLRPTGSKRRQADRLSLVPGLRHAMARLGAAPGHPMQALMADGFGADAAGEDRFDCTVGLLCVLSVLAGHRPDTAPDDPWVQRWEGWVLGQQAGTDTEGIPLLGEPGVREPGLSD